MAGDRQQLWLHEEIVLLTLRNEAGTFHARAYRAALGGALLAELLLARRVAVEDEKKQLVNPVSDEPLGEPLLDECLEKIHTAKRRAVLKKWLAGFVGIPRLQHRVAASLCGRGILRADEDQVLLLFHRRIYPEVNPRPERRLVERLRRVIFTDARRVSPRTTVLLSLARGANLLSIPFDRRDLKERKKRIESIVRGELLETATPEVTAATRAALRTAKLVSAVASQSSAVR